MAHDTNPISRLRDMLEGEIIELNAGLSETLVADYATYVGKVQFIRGLKRAVELCREAERDITAKGQDLEKVSFQHRYED